MPQTELSSQRSRARKPTTAVAIATLMFFGSSCRQHGPQIKTGDQVVIGANGNLMTLEQGWTETTREAYYFTDQGSHVMPYDWFLVLEQASSQELYRSDENIRAMRYLPAGPSQLNPDGLPVGFTRDVDGDKKVWLGLTCAACHTGQLEYKGTAIRIDGGQTLGDIETLNRSLVEAMAATADDEAKFSRFTKNVLGENPGAKKTGALHADLLAWAEDFRQRNAANHATSMPPYGYGRVDAIGQIFNYVMVRLAGIPENARASDAPVSYPYLWDTHQSDVVQWTGFSPNGPAGVGTLIRNAGEVLGVYGIMEIPDDKKKVKYPTSSMKLVNLGEIESWIAELRSPRWPGEVFPAIEEAKAQRGKTHYDAYCIECHRVLAAEDQGLPYKSVLTPIEEVGTDPREYDNMIQLRDAGKFEGRKEEGRMGAVIKAQTTGVEPLINAVSGVLLARPLKTTKALLVAGRGTLSAESSNDGIEREGYSRRDRIDRHLSAFAGRFSNLKGNPIFNPEVPLAPKAYKARPLNGTWATPPFLHNGSVPNYYELLLPAEQRSKTFYTGNREFDPERIGYVATEPPAGTPSFLFDTSLPGNSNVGHEYGTHELTEAERMDLLEYLKSL